MQLYKSRNFGEYFQDTFAFLKQNGKHLYKHFFIVNGIFLLILMIMGYFISKFYSEVVFGGLFNGNEHAIDEYINQNSGIFTFVVIIFILISLIAAIIAYAFVPIYLKLYIDHNGKHFNTKDIIHYYKVNLGKILIFLICGLIISIPIGLFAGLLSFILSITIIGVLLIPLVLGGVSLYYQGGFMEYIQKNKGIWESFGYSWKLLSGRFWAAIGAVGIFFIMAYIAQMVVTLIPYFFTIANLFVDVQPGQNPDPSEIQKSLTLMMLAIFLLTFFVWILTSIILQLNQGIVYYSLKEDNEHVNSKSDIDLIGTSE